jgi:hypothetical protein
MIRRRIEEWEVATPPQTGVVLGHHITACIGGFTLDGCWVNGLLPPPWITSVGADVCFGVRLPLLQPSVSASQCSLQTLLRFSVVGD